MYATIAIPALTLVASTPEIPSMPSIKLNRLINQIQRRAAAAASYQKGRILWKTIPCEPTHAIAAMTAAACATSRVTGESVRRSSIQEVIARAVAASNTILIPLDTGPGKYDSPLQWPQTYKEISDNAMTAMPPPRGVGLLWLDRSTRVTNISCFRNTQSTRPGGCKGCEAQHEQRTDKKNKRGWHDAVIACGPFRSHRQASTGSISQA